jgi:hypothetical protein
VPRKSRFRAHSVVSASSCHSRARERVIRRNIGRSAEPPRKFPSRLSAVFGIVIEAEIRVFQQYLRIAVVRRFGFALPAIWQEANRPPSIARPVWRTHATSPTGDHGRSLADPIVAKSSSTVKSRTTSMLHLRTNGTPPCLIEDERIRYADAQRAWRRPLGLGIAGPPAESVVSKSINDIEYARSEPRPGR